MKTTAEIRHRQHTIDQGQRDLDGDEEDPVSNAQYEVLGWLLGGSDSPTDDDRPVATSDSDLDAAIAALKLERNNLPEYSMFRDPNWAIIDAQIAELEWCMGS